MSFFINLFHFFLDNLPPLKLIAWLFPVSILWSFLTLYIAGICKKKYDWKTGYTRKLFHFFIFFSAVFFQLQFKLPGVFILGWAVTLAVGYACLKGSGNIFYEALAREKDAPFRTRYILYSFIATFAGGVLSNILFGPLAIFGYAVTGFADAIAEPVGTRFGKNKYKVFSFDKKVSYRSLEGSAAVFIATFIITAFLIHHFPLYTLSYTVMTVIALVCMIVEALSPSGMDNALLQITASFLCFMLIHQS